MPQQQLVEIASALGGNAKILILDEPTSSLTEREVENLFGVIRQLREAGVGMIYISHRMDELAKVADRVTVLRDGKCVGTQRMSEVNTGELIRMMVGRELSSVFPKVPVEPKEFRLANDESRLPGIGGARDQFGSSSRGNCRAGRVGGSRSIGIGADFVRVDSGG